MKRTLYDAEHESLRATVREFADRHLRPREDEFIRGRRIHRPVRLELAGRERGR